jgi:hypothetical protein
MGAKRLLGRNVLIITGDGIGGGSYSPSKVTICWTKGGKEIGGTGSAIKLSRKFLVPVVNLGDKKTLEICRQLLG